MKRHIIARLTVRLLHWLTLISLIMSSPGSALAAVWTDQEDYSPGSVVTISGDNSDGAGYLAGETVNVAVNGPNGYAATCEGVADANGAWSCQITLWSGSEAVGDYTYTATGQTSGVSQNGAFTDAAGSYNLKWYAADPEVNRAPYLPTYVKQPPTSLACPTPSGSGGRAADPLTNAVTYASPATTSNRDAVTSLAPKDMALGQIVPFELEISVTGVISPENGVIQVTPYWLAKTTSGDDFGYDPDYLATPGNELVYCAFVDTADPGTSDPGGNAKVDSWTETLINIGTNNEQIRGTFQISGLDNGDKVIVEIWVVLKDVIPAGSTGNVQTGLVNAQTATGDTINTGNQTVPLLRVQEFFSANADVSITKSDSPDPVIAGQPLTYSLVVVNNSTTTVANGIVVTDNLDPNTSFVSGSWPSGTCTHASGVVTCNIGALSPGQSVTMTIVVNVSTSAPTAITAGTGAIGGTCTVGSQDLCNRVSVTVITSDPTPGNNSDSEPTNVLPLATLQIVKNTTGGNDTFNFTATGSGVPASFSITTAGGTGSQTYTNLTPGPRTVTEQNPLPAGWSFTNLTCVDPDSGTSVSGQTATVDLDSGETVVCTYSNTKGGSITVVKNTVGGNGTFNFTSATLSNFSISTSGGTGNRAFSGLAAGTYDVSETVPSGWDLTSATCSDGSNPNNIGLSAGENVTCTFTNTKRGTLIVEKQTDPDGAAGNFTFTGTAAGTISDGGQIVVNNLTPGTYTATENNPSPAFALTSITCNDANSSGNLGTRTATFQLEAGETVKCTFTNTQQAGTLIVEKVVINNNGGTKTFSDFSFRVNSGSPVAFETDGQNELSVSAGTYNIIEPAVAGYTTSYNNCANVNVPAGGSATCTITNDDQPGTLIVKKIVVNDNGGTKAAADFSFSVNGGTAAAFEADGQNDLTVDAGTYSITEPAVAGYTTSYSNCANVVIPNGGSATCTITNDDQPGTLIVKKVVTNDNGGTKTYSDFSFSVNGGTAVVFEADGQNDLTVDADTYNITEPAVAGYTTTYNNCANVVIPNGGTQTCTITNDDQPGTLIVKKMVINDNGGTLQADDFSFSINGGSPIDFEADGQNDLTVDAGTYNITEPAVAGYSATYDNCSDVVIPNGGTATCTITNNDVTAHLRLVKQVTNNNGGDASATDWTLSASGPTPISGAGGAESDVSAGTYTLSEAGGPSGYTASAWVCAGGSQSGNQITLANGVSAVCTITNNDVAPTLTLIKNVVNNNGGTAGPNDFGLSIGGNAATSGTPYTLDANTPYVINEAGLTGYAFVSITGDAECPAVLGGSVTLDEGENITCTITNDDVAPTLTLIKTVTNDNGGDAVVADFPLFINGNLVTSGAANTLSANTLYTASETNLPGYTASGWGGDCAPNGTITLQPGDNKTCTITNNDVAPKLTLVKQVINNNGGTAGPNDFGLSIGGNAATSGVAYTLNANTPYAINEAGLFGYAFVSLTGAGCPANLGDSITLNEGDNITCTITNDDIQPKLIVIKHVVNDSGGTLEADDFTISVIGNSASPASFPGSETGTHVALNAGAYSVAEGELTGYTASYSADCAGTLAVGETKTCTITNDDQTGTIIVEKQTSPRGLAGNFTFTGDAAGTLADGEQITVSGLSAGAYTSTEAVPAGWQLTSIVCNDGNSSGNLTNQTATFNLENGETVKCVFTNDPLPTVTLTKTANPTTLPEPGGDFEFTVIITNTSPEPVTINIFEDSQTSACDYLESQVLDAGESATCVYTISHTDAGAYNNTASVIVKDNEGNSASDTDEETVTVTDITPTVDLAKSVDDNEKPEPGGVFNFTLTITNTSAEVVTITALTDTNALSAGCLALIGTTLTPGQSVSCTYSVTHTDAGSYPNTASVTVADDEGNPASDSDTQTVTVTDVTPTVELTKSVDDNEKPEPGGTFNFTLTITNTSAEVVTITALTDDNVLSAGCLALIGTSLNPGQSVSCTYSVTHTDAGSYPNTASVTVADDEGNSASDSDTQTVTVTDVTPTVELTKSVDDNEKPEPGGTFNFTLTVTNTSVEDVTITALTDDNALSTGCLALIGTTLTPSQSISCTYSVTHTDAGVYNNTANVTVRDNEGNSASDTDTETVTVTDVLPTVELTKSVDDNEKPEPGGTFNFTLTITNTSAEVVEITALTDTQAGATDFSTCSALISTSLNPGQSVSCTYSVTHTDAGSYPNTASVTVKDNENNEASDSDSQTVTVTDVTPTVELTKSVDDNEKPEPGGVFNFTLTITNTSVEVVEITALTDTQAGATDFSACSALIGTSLNPGQSVSCTYSVTHTDAGSYPNTASVTVADDEGNPASDTDTQTVTVTDVLPQISVEKTADPTSIPETGANVTFTFVVTNNSVESVTITELSDSVFGTLTGDADCQVNTVLGVGASCSFEETHFISGDYPGSHTNTFTAKAEDNEGTVATDEDDATVAYTDVLPDISVNKTASPTSVPETGGMVTFTFTVTNNSTEAATITALSDDKFGTLSGDADCKVGTVLASGASCDFSATFLVPAGDYPGSHVNTFTATVQDDDGNTDSASDNETITYTDVLPNISVSKTASPTSVPETGGMVTFTFTVTNHNSEAVTLTSLTDTVFGNLNGQGTCVTGGTIAGNGGTYACSITMPIAGDFEIGIPHENMVTAVASDNDGNSDIATDDATVNFTNVTADITIVKVTVDGGAFGDGLNILTGESIKWRYTVTNAGNYPLGNVTVTDSVVGVTPTYVSGDTNGNNKLDLTETWIYEASGTAIPGAYSNTGTASGNFTDGAGNVESDTATDTSSYFGANPQIAIAKVTVDGATSGDGLNILTGESIKWRYTVTNAGNVPLSTITVTDNKPGVTPTYVSGDTNSNGKLDLTETWVYEASGTAITGAYSNVGTARGTFTDSGGHSRTDTETDGSSYFGANPQIDVVKKTVGSDGTEGDNVFVLSGATVTWKYYVTNTGNVTLSNVTVKDNNGTPGTTADDFTVTCPQTTLAVGASMTCTATGTNTTPVGTWYNNIGTASGTFTDNAGHSRTPTDTDASAYYSGLPGAVTNSSLCDFGPNFRLVFTPDSRFYTSAYPAYKLSDSNPGQFFYNVFYTNNTGVSTIALEIPYPFVTQGAMPVHVYGGLTVGGTTSGTPSPDNLMNCFVPNNPLAAYGSIITLASYTDTNGDGRVGFGDVVRVNVPAVAGFQYINLHLDYGLEKTDGWVKQGSNANSDQTKYPGRANIRDLTAHTFKAYANAVLIPGSTDTVYNQNNFKQVRGFGGLVYTWNSSLLEYVPVPGAKVRLYKGTTLTAANLLETMTADTDGWYLSTYIHKGQAATYTLALLDTAGTTIIKTIQVTAGGSQKFGEGLFRLGGPTPNP